MESFHADKWRTDHININININVIVNIKVNLTCKFSGMVLNYIHYSSHVPNLIAMGKMTCLSCILSY